MILKDLTSFWGEDEVQKWSIYLKNLQGNLFLAMFSNQTKQTGPKNSVLSLEEGFKDLQTHWGQVNLATRQKTGETLYGES